ncbi:MAG: hypothetical protein LBR13_06095 [Dysgonamonadaceae bacterium]|jgi:O-antigen/teichoic acid export membrane protein|nr:hypothetical protein [Dysgonamonadaceae bacterium]
MEGEIKIGNKDVIWNYAATFMQVGAGIILLPFILHTFTQETVGIWQIFSTIIALSSLLDFGFNPSFARNVSYVVSGVQELKITGYQTVDTDSTIDYGLFKGLIDAMRWFYSRIALLLLILLLTLGSFYMKEILETYSGDKTEVYISWIILCAINTYSLYTYYYDSLMQGMGLIKRSKQIQIIGQLLYFIVAIIMILLHFNLIAVVSAQMISIAARRYLSYKTIFTKQFCSLLKNAEAHPKRDYIRPILPNAVKSGCTGLGGFLVSKSSIIIGSMFLSLDDIASYGITIQIVAIIVGIATVYSNTYIPKISQYRIVNNNQSIRNLYWRSILMMGLTFAVLGLAFAGLGDFVLSLVHSQTPLMPTAYIALCLLVGLLETNHSIAGAFLTTKNEVPYFKASIVAGVITVLLLFVFLKFTPLGVWSMVLAPGIAHLVYNNWKWPLELWRDLGITFERIRK